MHGLVKSAVASGDTLVLSIDRVQCAMRSHIFVTYLHLYVSILQNLVCLQLLILLLYKRAFHAWAVLQH